MFRDRQQSAGPVPLDWLLGAIQCAGEQEHLQSGCRPPLGPAAEQGLQEPRPLLCPGVLAPPVARLIDKDDHCGSTPAYLAAATPRAGYPELSVWADSDSPRTNSKAGRPLPVIAESRSSARIASSQAPTFFAKLHDYCRHVHTAPSLKCAGGIFFPISNGDPYDSSDPTTYWTSHSLLSTRSLPSRQCKSEGGHYS